MSVKIETVVPTAMMSLEELDGEELLVRAAQVGKRCVINLAENSRYLARFCDKLDQGELWRKATPTWDEFCWKVFGHPAYYVQTIRVGVALLDKGDDAPITAKDAHKATEEARRAEIAELTNKVSALEKHGTNQHKDGVKLLKSTKNGPTSEYLVARIKRDRPDIADRMIKGEFKSVNAAARESGIRVNPTIRLGSPQTVADAIVRLMGEEYAVALVATFRKTASPEFIAQLINELTGDQDA